MDSELKALLTQILDELKHLNENVDTIRRDVGYSESSVSSIESNTSTANTQLSEINSSISDMFDLLVQPEDE